MARREGYVSSDKQSHDRDGERGGGVIGCGGGGGGEGEEGGEGGGKGKKE